MVRAVTGVPAPKLFILSGVYQRHIRFQNTITSLPSCSCAEVAEIPVSSAMDTTIIRTSLNVPK
jgi:hypothetical protein